MKRNGKTVRWKMRIPLLFTARPLRITRTASVNSKGGFFHAAKKYQQKNLQNPVLQGILAAGHDEAEEERPYVFAKALVQCQKSKQGNQDNE